MNVDWNVGHSLSAGGPGASSALLAPVGSPLDALFPQESRTFRSNQLELLFKKHCRETGASSPMRLQSGCSINLPVKGNFELLSPSCFFTKTLNGWKKFATLLPNNWLDETPQTLASRRLGRQSAERERISEIDWNVFKLKNVAKLNFQTKLPLMYFTVILIGLKKFATLLPNYWLAETPQTLASRRLGRQSAERERISEIVWNVFKLKNVAKLNFQTKLPLMYFTIILTGLKKFATLLPNYWLAETPQTLASRRLGRQSAERERISEID
ncbi:hypothetical protein ACDX66_14035 [Peribacillus frigoritolerans]